MSHSEPPLKTSRMLDGSFSAENAVECHRSCSSITYLHSTSDMSSTSSSSSQLPSMYLRLQQSLLVFIHLHILRRLYIASLIETQGDHLPLFDLETNCVFIH
ncbi:hypothetical protein GEMRC1_007118 [Eukaryota sp. GEM-RC1]